jgi:hypothetical protein
MKLKGAVLIVLALWNVSCSDAKRLDVLERRLAEVEALSVTNREAMSKTVGIVNARLSDLEEHRGSAYYALALDGQNYAVHETEQGKFLISTIGVEPYLDGFKVRLNVGNLSSARFNGVKVQAFWPGPAPTNGPATYSLIDQEFQLTTVFPPGAWTEIEVALAPCDTKALRTASFTFSFSQAVLQKSKRD